MKYIVTINNASYEVEVEQGEARVAKTEEIAAVPVAAQTVSVSAAADADKPQPAPEVSLEKPQPAPPAQIKAGEKVTTPMPGTILQVKKQTGDAVKEGEVLFILEAMKMENEILSPKDGAIAQIAVAKGATVNTGDILAVLQ